MARLSFSASGPAIATRAPSSMNRPARADAAGTARYRHGFAVEHAHHPTPLCFSLIVIPAWA